jgi:hypothetical protein
MRPVDHHEFVTDYLCAAGGRRAEELIAINYSGKRADVVFSADNVIAEVKSLTTDRRNDRRVTTKLGDVMARNVHLGAPIVFGEMTVSAHDLPRPVAEQALRVVGARVRKEVSAAKSQIAATRQALTMPDAYGLLVMVTPPRQIGIETIAWLIYDALRLSEGEARLHGALLIETPLGMVGTPGGNSFLGHYAIGGSSLPPGLYERLGAAWGELTGQIGFQSNSEDFVRLGASE